MNAEEIHHARRIHLLDQLQASANDLMHIVDEKLDDLDENKRLHAIARAWPHSRRAQREARESDERCGL